MDRILFLAIFLFLLLPAMIESYNKILWHPVGFLVHFFIGVVSAVLFFYLRAHGYEAMQYKTLGILLCPFLFYSFYKISDWIVQSTYDRRLVITNKNMAPGKWGHNWLDTLLTILIIILSISVSLVIDFLIYR